MVGKMGKPLISVIVPIYNNEKFLKQCLDSIVNQTYQNIEIILVDDGSHDKSLEICHLYSKIDPRILVLSQENKGVSCARNYGLENVTGEYIGFIDSDDYISLDMYERLIDKAINEKADIVECGYFEVNDKRETLKEVKFDENVIIGNYDCCKNYLKYINTTNFNVNKIYHNSLFRGLKYPNLKYSEDYYMNNQLFLRCEKKATISDSCYYYVQHSDSATKKDFNKNKMDIIKSGNDVLKMYENKYPDLLIYVHIYILNKIRKLYNQVLISNSKEKKNYKNILINEYKKHYSACKKELPFHVKTRKNLIVLTLFNDCRIIHSLFILISRKI